MEQSPWGKQVMNSSHRWIYVEGTVRGGPGEQLQEVSVHNSTKRRIIELYYTSYIH